MDEIRFKPLEHVRLSDVAVQQIREMITSGKLKPGTQLPPERDLVEQLGVSRSSVREALRILEGMGLLEVKPGLGTFVAADLESRSRTLWTNWLLEHKDKVLDLLEAREALELRAALLAVDRITEEEIAFLEKMVIEMEKYVTERNVEGIVNCDREFHDTLCKASRNQFIATLNASLYAAMDEARTSVFTVLPKVRDSLVPEHRAIYEAIKARDARAAQESISYHMDSFREDIRSVVELQRSAASESKD